MSSPDGPTVIVADARVDDVSLDLVVDLERWERLARAVLHDERAVGELALTFLDRSEIAELNAEHMGTTGPTDVLSFPLDDEPTGDVPTLLGDVVVAPAVAAEQYRTHAGTYEDELALLVVHGILHVLGHDHAEPDEAATMRRREVELLDAHHWVDGMPAGFRQDHDDD